MDLAPALQWLNPFSPRALETRAARVGAPSESTFIGMQANIPQWGRDDYDALAREGYSRIPLVYSIISAIASSAAEARLRPMVGDQKKREELETGPLAQLLKQPNPRHGWYSFAEQYHMVMQYSGNVFIFKRRNRAGVPVQLRILRTGRMGIVPGLNGEPLRYEHRIDGTDYPIAPQDIIHIKREDPLDDWFGLSPLHVLARTSQIKTEMQKVQWGAFRNGGMMAGILTMDRELDDDEPEAYRQQWRRQFTGTQAGGIAVFGASLKYQQVAMDLDKMAMLDLSNINDTEICGVFQTPPSIVYAFIGLQRNTFNNAVEENRKWWENCLNPEIRLLIEGLTTGLRPDFGEDWELEADTSQIRALQDDEDAKHLRARDDFAAGGLSMDEFRAQIGQDPLGGRAGSLFCVPSNVTLTPLDELQNPPEPAPMPVYRLLPKQQPGGQQQGEPQTVDGQATEQKQAALPEARTAPEFAVASALVAEAK